MYGCTGTPDEGVRWTAQKIAEEVKPGDVVVINPKAYAVPHHTPVEDKLTGLMTGDKVEMVINFPLLDIDGVPHLFLYDRDVDFVVEDYEEVEDEMIKDVAPEVI